MTEQTIIPPSASDRPGQVDFSYAGFMDRLFALVLDQILLYIGKFVIFIPLVMMTALGGFLIGPAGASLGAGMTPSLWVISLVIDCLYFAGMESSASGATIGKRVMKIQVLDETGHRLTFGRAVLRYFGKIVSYIPLMLGFLMALFTARRQALHDIIASSIVVNR